jgi:hypothetical protein
MRRPVNGAAKLAAGLLVLVTLTASAESDAPEAPVAERAPGWEPALAVTSGFIFQPQEADVSSTIDSTGEPLRRAVDDTNWATAPYVGIQAEIMTPEIESSSGIRLFLNGEYLPTFAPDLDIAKEGDPREFELPSEGVPQPPCGLFVGGCNCPFGFGCYFEEEILGVGSKTTATIQEDVLAAAVGVAVPVRLLGRKLMLKPSFGWIRYEVDVQGDVLRGIKIDVISPTNPTERPVPIVRLVELHDSDSKFYNAIGPGLEVEMEVHQAGPIEATLFVDAHGYRVLGDRKVKLSDATTADCPPASVYPPQFAAQLAIICDTQYGAAPTPYSADWSFEVDPWLYRVGLGLRFRWTGE